MTTPIEKRVSDRLWGLKPPTTEGCSPSLSYTPASWRSDGISKRILGVPLERHFLSCDHRPKTSPWSMTELRNGTCMVFVCTCYVPTEKLRFWSHVSTGSWARLWYKFQIWTFEIGRSLKKCNRGAVADDRAISSIAPYIILFKWSIDVNLYTLVFFSFSLTLMCFINSVCQYNSI